MKKKLKIFISIGILLVVFLLICFLVFPKKRTLIDTMDVKNLEKENKTSLIYVSSNKKGECSNCLEIRKYLDKNKLNYKVYDRNKVSSDEYLEFLQYMHIDKKIFKLPALIYIKNGKVENYIMNIKDREKLKEYVKNYKLTEIK